MSMLDSKEKVDAWYESAMNGLGQALAYLYKTKQITETSGVPQSFYMVARDLSLAKLTMYKGLGIEEKPEVMGIREAARRHGADLLFV